MIEETILNYLSGVLSVPVRLEKQGNEPDSYVLLQRTGGGQYNRINSATFAVQSYGASLYEAASLNETVKTAMLSAPDQTSIFSCKLNSDYNFTDTNIKQHRYQAVYEITY